MKLSDGEKLILYMLTEIYEHLEIEDGIDPRFVQSAITTGNTFGLKWKYGGIFDASETSEEVVSEVTSILSMWDILEAHYAQLPPDAKKQVDAAIKPFDVKFRGFDGNNEGAHINAARFIIDDLARFDSFKGRDLDSHAGTLDAYRRMLPVYETVMRETGYKPLSAEELTEILLENFHPEHRKSG